MAFLLLPAIFGIVAPHAKATLTSTNVAFVPSPSGAMGGTLPTTDPAFAAFTFTNVPWASVTAANLASYDTVVLMIYSSANLNASQKTDLLNWVNGGGKLIIYDSESPSVDYSWLPYPMTTKNPGPKGYSVAPIVFVEDNKLGSTNPASPYYINITQAPMGMWGDYVGDCNTFVTYDIHWCGDIEAMNWYSDPNSVGYDGSAPSWTHTYAQYGSGLFIYNGFDINPLWSSTTPSSNGVGNAAKIWLMELQCPWGADYDLPCGVPVVVPVGGFRILTPLDTLKRLGPLIGIALIAGAFIVISVKTRRQKQ